MGTYISHTLVIVCGVPAENAFVSRRFREEFAFKL
jgi:hypothetical protein